MIEPHRLPIAVQCHVEEIKEVGPRKNPKRRFGSKQKTSRPPRMVVIDCETATERTLQMPGFMAARWPASAQALLFGRAHHYIFESGMWRKTDEYLFHADDLPSAGKELLQGYFDTTTYRLADGHEVRDALGVEAHLVPLSDYLDAFFNFAIREPCMVMGYNLSFDLSRLACRVGPSKTLRFLGGFSFVLWPDPTGKHRQHLYRPRLYIKNLGDQHTIIQFSAYQLGPGKDAKIFRPQTELLDLSQTVRALTSEHHTLESACKTFGLKIPEAWNKKQQEHGIITDEYLDYNRTDVEMTFALAVAVLGEFDRHPISWEHPNEGARTSTLAEHRAFSPASVAKAYLRGLGVVPRLKLQPDFPRDILGYCMTGYHGGRVEAPGRLVHLPIAYVDFMSMFALVNVLMGLWRYVVAARVEAVEDTAGVQSFLDSVTHDDLFKLETWKELPAIALIRPEGEILPTQARYGEGDAWTIGHNPYFSDLAQWYPVADLVRTTLRTGKAPQVLMAYRFVTRGVQSSLQPICYRGQVPIEAGSDLFKTMMEERQKAKRGIPPYNRLSDIERDWLQAALKTTTLSGSYGIYGQRDRQQLPKDEKVKARVWGLDQFEKELAHPERPGPFYFPPMVAIITAAARLMLALLERCVTESGGTYAFMDTDSMGIIASEKGGVIEIGGRGRDGRPIQQRVKELSWSEVEAIMKRFKALNPCDPEAMPGSILKIEDVNYYHCGLPGHDRDKNGNPKHCTCTKQQRPLFGYAISPKRYALCLREGNRWRVVSYKESALGALMNPKEPKGGKGWIADWWDAIVNEEPCPFADVPAVRKYTITSWDVYKRVQKLSRGKGYHAAVKPFNFAMTVAEGGLSRLPEWKPVALLAPFEPDSHRWLGMDWIDYHTGKVYRIRTGFDPQSRNESVRTVKSFGVLYEEYRTHPTPECLGPDGLVCGEDTRGILSPRPVHMQELHYVGKQTNEIERVDAGLVDEDDEMLLDFTEAPDWLRRIQPVLRDMRLLVLCRELPGTPSRTIKSWRSGKCHPEARRRSALERVCADYARDALRGVGVKASDHDATAMAIYCEEWTEIVSKAEQLLRELAARHGLRRLAELLPLRRNTLMRWINKGLPRDASTIAWLLRVCRRLDKHGRQLAIEAIRGDRSTPSTS